MPRHKEELVLFYNEYIATLKKYDKRGRLYKIATIGNTGIAFDFIHYLRILGHKVKVVPQLLNEDL